MPWVQKTTHAGKCIYIQRHYSSRYGSKNKCTRGSNYGKTSEAQAAVNNRQACLQQEMIFNANFGPGDLTATFTFRKADRPKDLQEIKKLWAAYMAKLRYAYKKAGVEFKWMRAIETPDKNPHIHMALSGIDLTKLPRWPYGRVEYVPVDIETTTPTVGTYARRPTSNKGTRASTQRPSPECALAAAVTWWYRNRNTRSSIATTGQMSQEHPRDTMWSRTR